jgi:hypothetical protein
VQEDINIPGNDLNSQPIQNDRQYYHDALGRLVYMMERTDVRTNLTFLEPQSENDIPTANRSFPFGTSFLYGPDGEEIYRVTRGNGIPGGEVFAVTLHDHAVKVAEYDSEHRITRSFQVIPGINTVLSAISFDDHGASTSTNYYRWDARGATLYLTNFEGNVVTDFQVSAPDGSRDLFGRTIGPGGVGRPERDQQRLKELWSFYQPSGPRTDLLLANAYQLEERTERITSQGLHPSIMQGGKNNYGFSISHPHIWTTQPLESSTAGTIAQGVLDFVRGVGDTVSFGFSKYIRQKIHGQDGEVLSPAAYTGGMITGIATSLVIGFGVGAMGRAIAKAAVTGAEVTVGWGYHVGRAYVIAGDIIGVGQSSYAWANGTLTPLDCLGFLPMVGWTAGRFKDHIKVIGKGIMYGIQKMPSGLKIGVTAGSEMAAIHHFSEAVHAGVVNAMKYVQIHRPREYLRLATGRSQGHHPFFRYIIRGFFPEEMSIVQRELYHHAANLQTLVPLRNSDHQLLHYAFDGAYPALAGNNILLHGAGRYGGGTARIRQAIANGSTQEQIADQLDEFYRIAYADDPALRDQFLAVTLQVRNFLGC